MATMLTDDAVAQLDGWWRAANYLSVGQIYLLNNPLLDSPLSRDDAKPRLLGHWVPRWRPRRPPAATTSSARVEDPPGRA